MKYYEAGSVPLTFPQLREAFLKLGLVTEELPITRSSAPVKVLHDGVPYKIDTYHDIDDIPTKAAKFYILRERHHADIKRLHEVWQSLVPEELMVMSGGGLQLQAFFSTRKKYEGILYLSHIDDGRFAGLEAIFKENGMPCKPYTPDTSLLAGPHILDTGSPWFETLPDVENIRVRHSSTYQYRYPEATQSE
jgi:hypothetical protein